MSICATFSSFPSSSVSFIQDLQAGKYNEKFKFYDFPAFLYEDPEDFDPRNVAKGASRTCPYMRMLSSIISTSDSSNSSSLQAARHILIAPSAGLEKDDRRNTRAGNITANFIIVGTREKSRDFRRASSSFCKKYNNSENFSTQTEFQTI